MNGTKFGETRDLLVLEANLMRLYAAEIDQAEVQREVSVAYHSFDGAPIRTYVLILTERVARQRLLGRARVPTAPPVQLNAGMTE